MTIRAANTLRNLQFEGRKEVVNMQIALGGDEIPAGGFHSE